MKYSNTIAVNEAQAVKNGERNIVTLDMLEAYLGGNYNYGDTCEALLDILNNIWPLDDAIKEVTDYAGNITPEQGQALAEQIAEDE